jgi:hypothetical protein
MVTEADSILDKSRRRFEKDLFISYAHLGNQPLAPRQVGWITQLHATLQALLDTRLGTKAEIWRDEKLTSNDIFRQEIVDQFPKTALFLSVVSPRYLTSEWCRREVATFCDCALKSGGLVISNKARIFKVIKVPVEAHLASGDEEYPWLRLLCRRKGSAV